MFSLTTMLMKATVNKILGAAGLTGIVVIVGTADRLAIVIMVGVMSIAGIVGIVVILWA